MQQRAGLLFLAKNTNRVLLILDNQSWTVPTFARTSSVLEDSKSLMDTFAHGRIVPIELYLSEDRGFEYGTYICLVDNEFLTTAANTICWSSLKELPKSLHIGLKTTLNNQTIKTKIDTIMELENATVSTTI